MFEAVLLIILTVALMGVFILLYNQGYMVVNRELGIKSQ